MSFFRDLRVAFYSLMRTPGLALTVILTLALGITHRRTAYHPITRRATATSNAFIAA